MDYMTPTGNTRKPGRFTTELARPRAEFVAPTQPEEPQVRSEEGGRAAWRPAVIHQRLNRIWRISIFILFLLILATIVHIVQFFVPSGLYANIVQGDRASVRQAPESECDFGSCFQAITCADVEVAAPFVVRPFLESNPEQSLSGKGVLMDPQGAVYAADIPRTCSVPSPTFKVTPPYESKTTGGRGFVKRRDAQGIETVYAVSAMHQLRCLVW